LHIDQIIKGCQKQKADCQRILYEQYYGVMMSICIRYGRTKEDAEEMLSNGFLKIFVHINQFEAKGSFEGWMKKTMLNSCLDFLKTKEIKSHHRSILVNDSIPEEHFFDKQLYDKGFYNELEIEAKFTKEELLNTLNKLPELTKTIFNLYVFEECTHKEICTILGIGERTSQWHLSNAKKELTDNLLKKKEIKKVAG
jgi:RNA polymerase sigma factor (sigma-70 family)